MNIVEVKSIINKFTKTGKRKDGTPYTKRFFIGIMEDSEERGISTFDHIEEGHIYEMELESHEHEGKTYWQTKKVTEWKESEPNGEKTESTSKQSPDLAPPALPPNTALRETALKCAIMSFNIPGNSKKQTIVSDNDILATARHFEEYLKNG